jgi:hypothetical protein
MAITEELHIDCAATTVFDLMADARNETRWNGSVSRPVLVQYVRSLCTKALRQPAGPPRGSDVLQVSAAIMMTTRPRTT